MAEMTPGLESLAEELDDFRALVVKFIGYAESLYRQSSTKPAKAYIVGSIDYLKTSGEEIKEKAFWLAGDSPLIETDLERAMYAWLNEFKDIKSAIIRDRNWQGPRWSPEDQAKLDGLKDWARAI